MNTNFVVGEIMKKKLASMPDFQRQVFEARLTNKVKMKMLAKISSLCEEEGYRNAMRLFLVPVFRLDELKKRVVTMAPELKQFFMLEMINIVEEFEKGITS